MIDPVTQAEPDLLTLEEAKDLAANNMGLAYKIIFRYTSPHVDRDELESVCLETLFRCARKFDRSRGLKFSTLAYMAIRRAAWDVYRKSRKRQERFKNVVSLDSLPRETVDRGAKPPWQQIDLANQSAFVAAAVKTIPLRLQIVVNGYAEGRTLIDIGRELGVSKERVRQIREEAYAMIRESLSQKAAA